MNFENLEGCRVTLLIEGGFAGVQGLFAGSNEHGVFLESDNSLDFFPFEGFQRMMIKKEDRKLKGE
ncbi:hypothetical protein [[Bacillus] enclensis]|uniref:hypothetical protein n=1 Tax=[Bacillus] enclensis TaxID=1402860 RepID=UPI00050A009F|nr:hypothetical protein [[Bacillus] enclensis]MBH9966091.1 hypothetical protein [[Bacillus] enclensis]